MYAVIADGGKQYTVRKGDQLYIETRELAEGADSVQFGEVLMIADGDNTRVGQPWVDGASVTAKLADEVRGPKEHIVKFRRRKGYRLKKGHRQNYLKVTIESINA